MRVYLIILFVVSFFSSSSQVQKVNGIEINAPNGFIKTGDLEWSNNDGIENVIVAYFKGNAVEGGNREYCKKGSRGSQFVNYLYVEQNGVSYGLCAQKGNNSLAILSTMLYRNGYTYMIMVSAETDDYERCMEIMGYMITTLTI